MSERDIKQKQFRYWWEDPASNLDFSWVKPDYGYWNKKEFWTTREATCLLIGIKPELYFGMISVTKYPGTSDNQLDHTVRAFYEEFRDEYFKISVMVRMAFESHGVDAKIRPVHFAQWASEKGFVLPEGLYTLVHPRRDRSA